MNPFRDQMKFMKACDQSVEKYNKDQLDLYIKLIREEFQELESAYAANDRIEVLDALIDMLVVTIGAVHSGGFDGEGAWKEVMRSNFDKIDKETGKVRKREDGKVLKPLHWTAPNLTNFVNK